MTAAMHSELSLQTAVEDERAQGARRIAELEAEISRGRLGVLATAQFREAGDRQARDLKRTQTSFLGLMSENSDLKAALQRRQARSTFIDQLAAQSTPAAEVTTEQREALTQIYSILVSCPVPLKALEECALRSTYIAAQGSTTAIARLLGAGRTTAYRKLKALKLCATKDSDK